MYPTISVPSVPSRIPPAVMPRRLILDREVTATLPPPVIAPANISRIALVEAAPTITAVETAPPERAISELSPLEVVAGSVGADSTSPNELAEAGSRSEESSGGSDQLSGRLSPAGGARAVGSGAVGRNFGGVAGDGRPRGPGGSGLDQLPSAAPRNPLPPYPPEALARGIEGRVVLRVWIRDDGTVEDVKIHETSGNASLDESALSTVRRLLAFRAGPPQRRQRILPDARAHTIQDSEGLRLISGLTS